MRISRFAPAIALLGLGVFFAYCFETVGELYFESYVLDLGSASRPAPRYMAFMALSSVFGGLMSACVVVAIARLGRHGDWLDRSLERWRGSRDIVWVVVVTLLALLIPLGIRAFLFVDTPVTDDEGSYQFAAELLASGRLTVDSPPLKLFHDRVFMINDGQLYSMYFLGWPALMVPGVWLGIAGFMNAIYFALTVPPLFAITRRLAGSSWAKLATIMYLASPMLLLSASTQLSNTSVVFAVCYALWFFMRSEDDDAPLWSHVGCALFFSLAFFIRPTAAIGTGGPIVALWLIRNLRRGQLRPTVIAAFVVPSLLAGGLFLYVNKAQNGSFSTVGYVREHQYARENDLRFTLWTPKMSDEAKVAHFRTELDPAELTAATGMATFRVLFSTFGLPFAFIFLFFVRKKRYVPLLWSMVVVHFLVHSTANAPGLDMFGPHRYITPALPLLLLVILGAKSLSSWLASHGATTTRVTRLLPAISLLVVTAVSVRVYLPNRLGTMARMTSSIRRPIEAVAELGLENAVIFAQRPFAPGCDISPTRGWVYWRPVNDPDRTNSILWVNHIDIEDDRRLMKFYPDRKGYVQVWSGECQLDFLPLDTLAPGDVARGFIGGSDKGLPAELTPEELERRRSQ